jgi:hypothetical protein
MAAALSLPALFLLVTGVLRHFRVLGRHFTPLLAVLIPVLSLGLLWLWRHGRLGRAMVVLYLGLGLVSALQVRFASRHAGDDYRAAVTFAQAALANGQRVWWAAAPQGADYYGLPLSESPESSEAAYPIFGQRAEDLVELRKPDLIVLSRPDIYDHQGGLATVLSGGAFSLQTNFPGFAVWSRDR